MITLGISIGTRLCGCAILNETELIHWKTHTFTGKWSPSKASLIYKAYEDYIISYNIVTVAIKIPHPKTHSVGITELLKKFIDLFKYHGCLVQYHTTEDIKKAVPEIKNSKSLVDEVTKKYPMLIYEKISEQGNKRPYHLKMFEAVLVAHIMKFPKGRP